MSSRVRTVTAFDKFSNAFAMGLAFHPPSGHGWRTIEMLAVGAYAVGWLGLLLGAGELWAHWQRARPKVRP